MAWTVALWALSFAGQAALLGAAMYGLVVLSDLEADFVNPHDCAASLNKWILPEYLGQAVLAALFLLTGRWLVAFPHIALAAWHARAWRRGDASLDVTEIFKQAPGEKRARAWRLAFYLLSFVYIIYRLVEASVSSLLSEEGRAVAHKLLQDAAAAHHV